MPIRQLAERLVDEIIVDLSDRCGLDDEWNSVEPAIREEIRQQWICIAELRISRAREEVT